MEFGSNRAHGRTGRLPRHTPGGRVAFPAVADVAPVVVSAWLAAIVDAYADPVGAE